MENGKYCQLYHDVEIAINVSLIKALDKMPCYFTFMKNLVQGKVGEFCKQNATLYCYFYEVSCAKKKKEDPIAFTISCTIGSQLC